MDKKKGFTLIELLAVMVVLVIVMLIAIPMVTNVIKKSEERAAERSAESYIAAVETAVATERLEGNKVNGTYTIESDGNLCPENGCEENEENNVDKIIVAVNGNKPTSGSVTITNGKVTSASSIMIGEYNIAYDGSKAKVIETIKVVGQICKLKKAAEEGNPYSIGSKYECIVKEDGTQKTFYVLEDGDNPVEEGILTKGKVSLIMDRNIGNAVNWCNDSSLCQTNGSWDNTLGPITATNYLQSQTSDWIVETSLPSYNQIYIAAGNKSSGFPAWLYNYTYNCTSYGCDVGNDLYTKCYWTSTGNVYNYSNAWNVYYGGTFQNLEVWRNSPCGVRPVITVLKSKLSS